MGLLDDLLGQLAGDTRTAEAQRRAPASASSGGGMAPLLTALLPVVLSMLSGSARDDRRSASAGGGLGDVLAQVLGGSGASSGAGGGLGALLEQFQRAGFGEQAGSWVGTGANQALPDDALARVFGRNGIAEIARRAGVSEQDAERGLSAVLPEVVDRMTPDGQMPAQDRLLASVDDLTRRLGL